MDFVLCNIICEGIYCGGENVINVYVIGKECKFYVYFCVEINIKKWYNFIYMFIVEKVFFDWMVFLRNKIKFIFCVII